MKNSGRFKATMAPNTLLIEQRMTLRMFPLPKLTKVIKPEVKLDFSYLISNYLWLIYTNISPTID